ncbi:hypothetical protein ASG41_13995 [Modestobacter sp. Leaf380]|nr:hypothetical protein ASG41_13995 [Modestobacter sp. Leaf380]
MRAEWIKFSSLRSTWVTLVAVIVATVGLGWLFAAVAAAASSSGDAPLGAVSGVALSLAGAQIAWIAFGVLGVLEVTGEYSHGSIGPTFSADPRRWPTLLTKVAVLAFVVLITGGVSVLTAFILGQAALGGAALSLTDDGVVRVLVATTVYLAGLGLIGQALGWLLRSTAGAVAALFGLVFLLPGLGQLLPSSWGPDVVRWLPAQAGQAAQSLVPGEGDLAPVTGLVVFLMWVLLALVAAAVATSRRDA